MNSSLRRWTDLLRCPACRSALVTVPAAWPAPQGSMSLKCQGCSATFPVVGRIPFLLPTWAVGWLPPRAAAAIWKTTKPALDLPSFIRLVDRVSSPALDEQGLWERAVAFVSCRSAAHDRWIRSEPSIVQWNERAKLIDSYVIDRVPGLVRQDDLVLDICSGEAQTISHIALKAPRCTFLCVDKQVSFLEAKQHKWNQRGRPMMVCADVRSLPLPDACAEVVVDNNGLFHVVDAATAVREVARVTKPKAHVVMSALSTSLDGEDARLRELTGGSLGFGWLIDRYGEAGFEAVEKVRICGKEHNLPETEGAILRRAIHR